MNNSKLLIGLGIGLVVGASVATYFTISDKDKRKIVRKIDRATRKAKNSATRAINHRIDELEEKAEHLEKMARNTAKKLSHEK
jgi:hypothetical protein